MKDRQPSMTTIKTLRYLLSSADNDAYGYAIMKATGIKSGSLYPILMRLTERGQLTSKWTPPEKPGRPPRQTYRLTVKGIAYARQALLRANTPLSISQKNRPIIS